MNNHTLLFARPTANKRTPLLLITYIFIIILFSLSTASAQTSVCASRCDHLTIQGAIDALGSGGTIVIGAGTYYENLHLHGSYKLQGAGADLTTIHGGGLDRVIVANLVGATVELEGLTITGGDTEYIGGGIYSENVNLLITDSIIAGNHADLHGGGIWHVSSIPQNTANLTLRNVDINSNTAEYSAGGVAATSYEETDQCNANIYDSLIHSNNAQSAGGILANCDLNVIRSSVTLNVASSSSCNSAGGISAYGNFMDPSSVKIVESVVNENIVSSDFVYCSTSSGGGIRLRDANLILNSSTVSHNRILNYASEPAPIYPRICGAGIYSDGDVVANNSTISHNSIESLLDDVTGGGLCQWDGEAILNSSTIAFNSAGSSGAAVYPRPAAELIARNSIIAKQELGTDCNVQTNFTSDGYNIFSDSSCNAGSHPTDQLTTDPLLSRYLRDSGMTLAHVLRDDSPAIDAGNPLGCKGDRNGDGFYSNLVTDQSRQSRVDVPGSGQDRPWSVCDIGAMEFNLIGNGGLESDRDLDKMPDGWIGVNLENSDRLVKRRRAIHAGRYGFVFRNRRNVDKEISRSVVRSGLSTDSYQLSLWNAALNNRNFSGGEVHAGVRFELSDGTVLTEALVVGFDSGTYPYRNHSETIYAGIDGYEKITVFIRSINTRGLIAVDDISLVPLQ